MPHMEATMPRQYGSTVWLNSMAQQYGSTVWLDGMTALRKHHSIKTSMT